MKRFVFKVLAIFIIPLLIVTGASPVGAYLPNEYFRSSNNIVFSGDDSGAGSSISGDFIYYSQSDEKWSSKPYTSLTTIGRGGCGPTSLAMIVATLIDSSVTPVEVADVGAKNDSVLEGEGTVHAKLLEPAAQKWGFTYTNLGGQALDAAIDVINRGGLVYMSGTGPAPFTDSGHVVVMRGVTSSGEIIIADPYGGDRDVSRGVENIYPRSTIEAYRTSTFGITKI